MKAVFEEINGEYAVFLVEELGKTFHVNRVDLPEDAVNGDVFEVEIDFDNQLKLLEKLPDETMTRKASAQLKRKKLLERHSKK